MEEGILKEVISGNYGIKEKGFLIQSSVMKNSFLEKLQEKGKNSKTDTSKMNTK